LSHSRERKEKICLNCNADLHGRFCHVCGQENLEPKESVWGLISHFFYDITHFDGKFFSTLKHLVAKPGFLSKEYLRGRRASYLNPIKMYVFTSAIFFIIFYSMFSVDNLDINLKNKEKFADSALIKLANAKEVALRSATNKEDSASILDGFSFVDKIPVVDVDSAGSSKRKATFSFSRSSYKNLKEYDSIQNSRPLDERDGWLKRKVELRRLEITNKYRDNDMQFLKDVLNSFIHSFPSLLFVSLPLYAFFLKLLYIRRRQFYYVHHGIFLIHLYIFTFIVLLVLFALIKLNDVSDSGWIYVVQVGLILYGIYYTLKAMRNFYGQGWFKTFVKFLLLNFLAFISLIVLFSLFFVLTVFRV
jgi:Protein of unknown function (DUF3667)